MSDEMRDRVAEQVREHNGVDYDPQRAMWVCLCGTDLPLDGLRVPFSDHLADALLPLLAEAEARGVEQGRAEVRWVKGITPDQIGTFEERP